MVWSHITLCIARELAPPCCSDDDVTPRLFQRPILRLVASGSSWVAIFFILLGFVNALKPLKLARSAQADTACSKLAASALSRIFRLVFPAAAATVVSWAITQLGFYETGRQSDAFWLANNTPVASENIFVAVVDLKNAIRDTWFLHRENPYDQPQWALIYLLQGSMMVILALLITVNMTLTWRTLCLAVLAQWSLNWSHDHGDRESPLQWLKLTLTVHSFRWPLLLLGHYIGRVRPHFASNFTRSHLSLPLPSTRYFRITPNVLPSSHGRLNAMVESSTLFRIQSSHFGRHSDL